MPPLHLAPWEIVPIFSDTPDGCGHLVQSILWKGSQCDFLFRVVGVEEESWVIFARRLDSDDEGNWVVCNGDSTLMCEFWNTGHSYYIGNDFHEEIFSADEPLDPADYIERIVRRLENHGPIVLGRIVSVARGETQEYALLTSKGKGLWMDESFYEMSSFRLPLVRDWLESGRGTSQWLHQQLSDSASDASFSRRWKELGADEHTEVICGGPENVAEIHNAMRWALQSQRKLWDKAPSWEWYLSDAPDFGTLIPIRDDHPGWIEAYPPLLATLSRFLVESYIERFAVLVHQRYQCTYDYPGVDSHSWTFVKLDGPPTAHEQLEAALSLRQWLQTHATPEEFAEIWRHIEE